MKISILGCGRWGSFLAYYADKIGHDALIWGRPESPRREELAATHRNAYLTLPAGIGVTDSLEYALGHADAVIVAIGAQELRNLAGEIDRYDVSGTAFVLCMKGIEAQTGMRLTQVFQDGIKQSYDLAVWLGPGHVQDFLNGIPNCMVIGSDDINTTKRAVDAFRSDLIRFYYEQDLIGIEVGAASKNAIGIAAGMLDGLNMSSLKGALMARGTREIRKLVRTMGGNELTIYGLCHLGDYEATLFSSHSHNRRFGEALVRKEPFERLAEGVDTIRALRLLSRKHDVDMPICDALYAIVHENEDAGDVLRGLFLRSIKFEHQ